MTVTQRWRGRRASYRPAGEPIDTRLYGVDLIGEAQARAFVVEHHYSASYPAARCRVGLFRSLPRGDSVLVGVAVFSVPCNPATTVKYLGLAGAAGAELGRFVLTDDVPANGETFFLARALRALRGEKPDVAGVVSFSDPTPRTTRTGDVVMPGHIGTIYQAANAHYLGRASPATLLLDDAGRVVSARGLSKLRGEERGHEHVYRRLVAAGAPPRAPAEDLRAYVTRVVASGAFRRLRHPGNHVYAWPLDRCRLPPTAPYPKRDAETAR